MRGTTLFIGYLFQFSLLPERCVVYVAPHQSSMCVCVSIRALYGRDCCVVSLANGGCAVVIVECSKLMYRMEKSCSKHCFIWACRRLTLMVLHLIPAPCHACSTAHVLP